MNLQDRIESLVKLGAYLQSDDPALQEAKLRAQNQNGWFIPEFINLAIGNICSEFLQQEKLESWISSYTANITPSPKKVGITMAGNIPMVGFHDFLCGYLSGHHLLIKYSAKDNVLLSHCVNKLSKWYTGIETIIQSAELLKNCDAYIATGSNNSARYFEYYFARFPHIIRRNRTSVAILTGGETVEELSLLADDIFQYFGLGCRNVTKIYVPKEYDFALLLEAFGKYESFINYHLYKNNYDYHLALMILNKADYLNANHILLMENQEIFSPIGVLHYESYDQPETIMKALQNNDDVQCVVSKEHIPFGKSQQPSLSDYADGVDTMSFLLGL